MATESRFPSQLFTDEIKDYKDALVGQLQRQGIYGTNTFARDDLDKILERLRVSLEECSLHMNRLMFDMFIKYCRILMKNGLDGGKTFKARVYTRKVSDLPSKRIMNHREAELEILIDYHHIIGTLDFGISLV